jgi:tetratricopeptide (TPR) repeat protein
MARRISSLLLFLAFVSSGATLAAGLDDKGKADAREATHLFNLGKYEEAAPIYAKLAVDHPDMAVFLRNLGACNYYLRKPEPALSSLRRYLKLRSDIKPEDRATVERWMDEMEKLRAARSTSQEPATSGAAPHAGAKVPASTLATAAPPLVEPDQPMGLRIDAKSDPAAPASRPFYKTWWFWTGAAVAAAAVTTAIILSRDSSSPCDGRGAACLVTE